MTTVINRSGASVNFESAVNLMDDDIREKLHLKLDPPRTEQEFFSAYERAHVAKYGVEWELSKSNPVW